jgi:hypothetical protein
MMQIWNENLFEFRLNATHSIRLMLAEIFGVVDCVVDWNAFPPLYIGSRYSVWP